MALRLRDALVWLLILVLLVPANYLFGELVLQRLWGMDGLLPATALHMPPVATPLVYWRSDGNDVDRIEPDFLQTVGLNKETARNLQTTHPLMSPVAEVVRMNPYPPILDWSYYGDVYSSLLFGYFDRSGEYVQVTYYFGEADTTPSYLVRKVRGNQTWYGDYFVVYSAITKKRTRAEPEITDAAGRVLQWDPPPKRPNLMWVDWCTWEGGSYDGVEEVLFAMIAVPIELVILYVAWRKVLMFRRGMRGVQAKRV